MAFPLQVYKREWLNTWTIVLLLLTRWLHRDSKGTSPATSATTPGNARWNVWKTRTPNPLPSESVNAVKRTGFNVRG